MHDFKVKIDLHSKYRLFGGIIMVLGGNFRQIFSMIRKRQNMILLFLQLIDPFNRQIVFC